MQSVLEYLYEAARIKPERKALGMENESLTYAELLDYVKCAASGIRRRLPSGCTQKPIPVFANQCPETVALFLAVAESGNVYVPLDPDWQPEKLSMVLADTEAELVLGGEQNQGLLQQCGWNGSFAAGKELIATPLTERESISRKITASDPLYIIYTSGSTGKPKGVLKSHGAVISFVEAYCRKFDFSENEVIGNQTPFFFDASAKDIYLMLKTAATLEIVPVQFFTSPPLLMQYLDEKRVSFISWVPSALSVVCKLNGFDKRVVRPQNLSKVFFVGEVMPMKYLNEWREVFPQVQFVNLYGQSEIAGVCLTYEVEGTYEDSDTLPMGKPLDHCRVYLVRKDEAENAVELKQKDDGNGSEDPENKDGGKGSEDLSGQIITEAGQGGEIYLVSDALALEYYKDPEKTGKAFRMVDFGDGPVRAFRTGDNAYFDKNGDYHFSARDDQQIKHMGHRIELGEIETAALALPELSGVCCLYNDKKQKITLFATLADGVECGPRDIQRILFGRLSKYMVPGKVILLEKIPVNANGKTDRQYLKSLL